MKFPLTLSAFCLIACLQSVDAKSDDDNEVESPGVDLENVLNSNAGCGSTAGCVIASGAQVADLDLFSRAAFGQFTFEFDPGFTRMNYSTEVYDPLSVSTSFNVANAGLYCLVAGNPEETLDTKLLAELNFNQGGGKEESFLIYNDVIARTCGSSLEIDTIASLHQAMTFGLVSVIFELVESPDNTLIRGQVFAPQEYFMYY